MSDFASVFASDDFAAQLSTPAGIERHHIESRDQWLSLRTGDVTASVAACLFGVHEYQTEFGLWAAKRGMIAPVEETPAMRRGSLLEPVAAMLLREDNPTWQVRYPVATYYRDPANRIGCTPDIQVIDPLRHGFGNVQVKSVEQSIFRKKWRQADGTIEPPLWISVQSAIEAALTGASWAAVAPLVIGHGVDMPLIEIPIDHGLVEEFRKRVKSFWRRVEDNDPPAVDYGKDADVILEIYADANEDELIDLSGSNRAMEIAAEIDKLKVREADGNDAKKSRKGLNAELLMMMGNAAKARLGDGRFIFAKTIKTNGYTVQPGSYRRVDIKSAESAKRKST